MSSRIRVTSIVIGQPSEKKANGVLRYIYDLDKIFEESKKYKHEIFAIKKRDFIDPFFLIPKPRLLRRLFELRSQGFLLIHGVYMPIYLLVLMICSRSKFGIMPHGSFHKLVLRKRRFVKSVYLAIAYRLFILRKVVFFVLSDFEESDTRSVFKDKFPVFIFGPVILGRSKPVEMNLGIRREQHRLLYIGRYDISTKGLDTLVETALLMKDDDVVFQLRGPSDVAGYRWLEEEIENKNLHRVMDLGSSVFGEEKSQLLQDASLFVLLSRNEGMPLSVIEALSYSCPAIVTEATNVPAYSRTPCPVSFVSRDPADIAQKIRTILSNEELLREMKVNALLAFNEHYSESSARNRVEEKLDLIL